LLVEQVLGRCYRSGAIGPSQRRVEAPVPNHSPPTSARPPRLGWFSRLEAGPRILGQVVNPDGHTGTAFDIDFTRSAVFPMRISGMKIQCLIPLVACLLLATEHSKAGGKKYVATELEGTWRAKSFVSRGANA